MYAAPLAAVLAGCAAEWLDFRALRYPLLAMVLAGVTLTRYAHDAHDALARDRAQPTRGSIDALVRAVALVAVTWSAAETVYVLLHVLQGERFEADRFGPQPMQALALIAAHGVFLGAPTGIVAWGLLRVRSALRAHVAG
jgi:hypothetical protein